MRLTKAQERILKQARDYGGVFTIAVDPSFRPMTILRNMGLLSMKRDEHGYYNITDEGRAHLQTQDQSDKGGMSTPALNE